MMLIVSPASTVHVVKPGVVNAPMLAQVPVSAASAGELEPTNASPLAANSAAADPPMYFRNFDIDRLLVVHS